MKDLFQCYPALLTYRDDNLPPRSDGKLKPDYQTVDRAPTQEDFDQHIAGEVSLGCSPLLPDDTAQWGVIDIDIYQARDEVLEEIVKALMGSVGALFRSKSQGLHFYMFAEEPVPATDMVEALKLVRSRLLKKHRAKAKEIFPRQISVKEVKTPSQVNLPLFGAKRGLVRLFARTISGQSFDTSKVEDILDGIRQHTILTADEIRKLAEENRDREKGGRRVPEVGPVGYREPDPDDDEITGRQKFLHSVGSSMRARGADIEQIREQLFEIDKLYADIPHPLWKGKGKIDPKRIESALKQITKYKQGTPSGLLYREVEKFNEEFAILNLEGRVEVLDCTSDDFKTWAWGDFVKWVKPRRVKVGAEVREIAPLWLMDIDRRQYSGVVIEPEAYDGARYNLFKGFQKTPLDGDPSPFTDGYVRDVLCSGDADLARWVLHYLADTVQRSTEPSPATAIAIRGPQGQGKSFLFKFMKAMMGRAAREVPSADRLFSRFNRSIAGLPLIGAEEAIFSGDPRVAQILKTFISSDLWTYEEKYKATVEMKNVHRLIATTNSEHAVLIEDDDRRWTVIEVPQRWDLMTENGKRVNWTFWDPLYGFLRGDGPGIVLRHLLDIEVDRQMIAFAYLNRAKADDKLMSDPVLAFLDEVAEIGVLPHDLEGCGFAANKSIMEAITKSRPVQARGLTTDEVSKRIRKIVPHAYKDRKGVFVENWRVGSADSYTDIIYNKATRQRGIDFGLLSKFRSAISKITQRRYSDDTEWGRWEVEAQIGQRQAFDGDFSKFKKIMAGD